MLVLFETPAGYAIFKMLDEKKLSESENLFKDFETPEAASKIIKLKHFEKFKDTSEALASATALVEGKMSKRLKKVLKKLVVGEIQDELAVADAKLGNSIKEKLDLNCVSNSAIQELMRCIRSQMDSLISGLPQKELAAMALGLAHSLSRYKLKFSPDKVDTMIIQAICLLDDLDKELNNYIMRCREWYGWHFPEMGKIIQDHVAFAKSVKLMGVREKAHCCDFSSILPEEIEVELKEAAEISMGTEISEEDIENITFLCEQVLEITEYRAQLYDYLKNRMLAIAPNLTVLVGELVGARLISHAGSLMNLAKAPASTVQILGAEKALFRALKTKHDTPKYGLIFHASMVGQSNPKHKGKVSRMLAAKASLAVRYDALGEDSSTEIGISHRAKLEKRLRILEEGNSRKISGTGKQLAKWDKYQNKSEVKSYDISQDSTIPPQPQKRKIEEIEDEAPVVKKMKKEDTETEVAEKKKKKKKAKVEDSESEKTGAESEAADESMNVTADEAEDSSVKKKKKKKKIKTEDSESEKTGAESEAADESMNVTMDTSLNESVAEKPKKKKKVTQESESELNVTIEDAGSEKKKKKKKIKSEPE